MGVLCVLLSFFGGIIRSNRFLELMNSVWHFTSLVLDVVKDGSKIWVIDNRHLYCFKEYQKLVEPRYHNDHGESGNIFLYFMRYRPGQISAAPWPRSFWWI